MGWEARGNGGRYYYRKLWRDGRCVSQYVPPLIAALAELEGAEERAGRQAEARLRRAERDRLEAEERALDAYCERVGRLAEAALEAGGYHRHERGAWRKRRGA